MSTAASPRLTAPAIPSWLVVLIAAPPLAAFTVLAAYVTAESLGFRALTVPAPTTLAEAAAAGAAARVVELIGNGLDPNAPSLVPAGAVDADAFMATAVEAAILGRRAEMVNLLREQGARLDPAHATCLARASGLPDVLELLGSGTGDVGTERLMRPTDALHSCARTHSPEGP